MEKEAFLVVAFPLHYFNPKGWITFAFPLSLFQPKKGEITYEDVSLFFYEE